jgi:hypothetical protein
MNRKLATTTIVAFGLAVLAGMAVSQEMDKDGRRRFAKTDKAEAIKDDSGSVAKDVPTTDRPLEDDLDRGLNEKKGAGTRQDKVARSPDEKYQEPQGADLSATRKEAGRNPRLLEKMPADAKPRGDAERPDFPRDLKPSPEELRAPGVLSELPRGPMTAPSGPGSLGYPGQPGNMGQFVPGNLIGGEGKLVHEAEQVARLIGAAKTDAEKDRLKYQLRGILEKQFDFRQRRHEGEIVELEAQVRKLRERIQKRHQNRRDIISERLEVIVRDAEGLGW